MRALFVPAPGQPPRVGELPRPVTGAGEVLVRVRAAALNPMDNTLVSGALSEAMEHRYPLVLGRDVSGVVEEVGEGVDDVAVGSEVLAHVPFTAPFEAGTVAELALVPAAGVVALPEGLDPVTAAALPLAGAAALVAIEAAAVTDGQVVLVNGASGGVGRYAVQLLVARGATVVATGRPGDAERLRELGARDVVDFTRGSVVEQVRRLHPQGVDALVNLWGDVVDDVPLGAVRPGGSVSSIRPVPDVESVETKGLTGGGFVLASPGRDTITTLAALAAAGTLHTDIQRVVALDDAVSGLDAVAAGRVGGKVVVDLQA